ncbi:MAG: tetratricopeptide repeat protein [Verrucomicrobia bacterium]|jgi:tetratricopeptide (TPR) repeat protein|nr:tetratricopeptide repeat protein [Verrucomicrobiota bacterium]
MRMKKQLVAALLTCAISSQAFADWEWQLSATRYMGMNAFERAQYTKAKKQCEAEQYRAAAAEFDKFKIQFDDSDYIPYVVFMRGYCLHKAKERGQAIMAYNEVMDYFPDKIEEASAALYYLGLAQFENGDERKGILALKEMAEDEDYSKHPLAAHALTQLANNHIRNKEPEQALKYWQQAVNDFGTTNMTDVLRHGIPVKDPNVGGPEVARLRIAAYCLQEKQMSSYDKWMSSSKNAQDPKHRRGIAEYAHTVAVHGWVSRSPRELWDRYYDFNAKRLPADKQLYWEWFKAQKTWYAQDDALWRYYEQALVFCTQLYGAGAHKDTAAIATDALAFIKTVKESEKALKMYSVLVPKAPKNIVNDAIRQAVALVALTKDPEKADAQYEKLAEAVGKSGQLSLAVSLTGRMKDRLKAGWTVYTIMNTAGKHAEAAVKLEELEGMGDDRNKKIAQERRAAIYHNVLREYEKAIKLYQVISEPPSTLFQIAACYNSLNKRDEAIQALTEIQSSFSDQAAQALWTKASYYRTWGNGKYAIGSARQLLKAYPKTSWSARAHEMLESYGVKTGGGVVDGE